MRKNERLWGAPTAAEPSAFDVMSELFSAFSPDVPDGEQSSADDQGGSAPAERKRKVKKFTVEYDDGERTVHHVVGGKFNQTSMAWLEVVAQQMVAHLIPASHVAVMLYLCSVMDKGEGSTKITQRQLLDGLNAIAAASGKKLMTRQTLSTALTRLEKAGWIHREGDVVDVNPRLAFYGGSILQEAVLAALVERFGHKQDVFPYHLEPEELHAADVVRPQALPSRRWTG